MSYAAAVQTPSVTERDASEATDRRARLKKIIEDKSYRSGTNIKLASGKVSEFYFNMKPTMMDPEGASLLCDLILELVESVKPDYIGGLEMGAVPIVSSVSPISHHEQKPLPGFFVRKKPKEHGTGLVIEGLTEDDSLRGKRVVVVDDVTTTGGSVYKAVHTVQEEGGEVVLVLTVVDRQEGAEEHLTGKGLNFEAIYSADEFK